MLEERLRKKYPHLTKSQKKVANFFLNQGEEAAFLSISDLARLVHASESTIIRFSRAAGYQGYPGLQKELQSWIRKKISPDQVLQQAIAKEGKKDIYSQIFETDIRNLTETQERNHQEVIDRAVKEMIKAKKIGITGFRSSHAMAYLLFFFIGQVRKNVALLDASLGILPSTLISYGAGDLLLGISFARYGAPTLDILKYGKRAGCKILALTDSPISPIGQIADIVLIAGGQSSTYFNSFASAVSLINCLVAGVSLKSQHSVKVLKAINEILDEWKLLSM
jgi:DNA-binding MurR/RpiR family transcriptional regulator